MRGIRGADFISLTKLATPCTRLRPPYSSATRAEIGFTSGKLLGASASSKFCARKRTRLSARQSISAILMKSIVALYVARYDCNVRRRIGLCRQALSANRRSFGCGASSESPATISPSSCRYSPTRPAVTSGLAASLARYFRVDPSGKKRVARPGMGSMSSVSSREVDRTEFSMCADLPIAVIGQHSASSKSTPDVVPAHILRAVRISQQWTAAHCRIRSRCAHAQCTKKDLPDTAEPIVSVTA